MPKLTKSVVDRAEVPAKGQAFVWCSEDRGFGVRINASGARTSSRVRHVRVSGRNANRVQRGSVNAEASGSYFCLGRTRLWTIRPCLPTSRGRSRRRRAPACRATSAAPCLARDGGARAG